MIHTYKDVINNNLIFWNKINNLVRLFWKFNIPDWFIIESIENLDWLLENDKKYIIRSSANIEDSSTTSCAWLFDSKIIYWNNNLEKESLNLYNNIDFDSIKMFLNRVWYNWEIKLNFLVQEFIYWDFSWVYFSDYDWAEYLEYIKWPNSLLVDWLVNASSVTLLWNKKNIKVKKQDYYLWEDDKKVFIPTYPKVEEKKLNHLFLEFQKIRKIFDFDIDVEWTIVWDIIYILQVRKIN